jgi:hypothetical protein
MNVPNVFEFEHPSLFQNSTRSNINQSTLLQKRRNICERILVLPATVLTKQRSNRNNIVNGKVRTASRTSLLALGKGVATRDCRLQRLSFAIISERSPESPIASNRVGCSVHAYRVGSRRNFANSSTDISPTQASSPTQSLGTAAVSTVGLNVSTSFCPNSETPVDGQAGTERTRGATNQR